MKKIVDFYKNTILTSPKFNSPNPVSDMDLLLPEFKAKWAECVNQYKAVHPEQDVLFTETYRSNTLQEIYFNQGASKIRKDGMHHFGIAGDSIFVIAGKRTYKGDVNLLRKIYKQSGLTILGMWDPLHVQFIPVEEQAALRKMIEDLRNTLPDTHGISTISDTRFIIAADGNGQTATLNITIRNTDPGMSDIKIEHNTNLVHTVNSSSTVTIPNVLTGDIIDVDCRTLGDVQIDISGVNADKPSLKFSKPGGFGSFNIR